MKANIYYTLHNLIQISCWGLLKGSKSAQVLELCTKRKLRGLSARRRVVFPLLATAESAIGKAFCSSQTMKMSTAEKQYQKPQLRWMAPCNFHITLVKRSTLNLPNCKRWAVSSPGTAHSVHTSQCLRFWAHSYHLAMHIQTGKPSPHLTGSAC